MFVVGCAGGEFVRALASVKIQPHKHKHTRTHLYAELGQENPGRNPDLQWWASSPRLLQLRQGEKHLFNSPSSFTFMPCDDAVTTHLDTKPSTPSTFTTSLFPQSTEALAGKVAKELGMVRDPRISQLLRDAGTRLLTPKLQESLACRAQDQS